MARQRVWCFGVREGIWQWRWRWCEAAQAALRYYIFMRLPGLRVRETETRHVRAIQNPVLRYQCSATDPANPAPHPRTPNQKVMQRRLAGCCWQQVGQTATGKPPNPSATAGLGGDPCRRRITQRGSQAAVGDKSPLQAAGWTAGHGGARRRGRRGGRSGRRRADGDEAASTRPVLSIPNLGVAGAAHAVTTRHPCAQRRQQQILETSGAAPGPQHRVHLHRLPRPSCRRRLRSPLCALRLFTAAQVPQIAAWLHVRSTSYCKAATTPPQPYPPSALSQPARARPPALQTLLSLIS